MFAVRDYKPINEENESVVAVYNELSGSWTKTNTTLKGRITLHDELGEVAEATAVLILMTILYKTNEDWKDLGRALNRNVLNS
jgi:hypothetical protein